MTSRSIKDSQITASSYDTDSSKEYAPHLARLNNDGTDFWATSTFNPWPWIQVDFLISVELYGIQTKGFYDSVLLVLAAPQYVSMLQVKTGDSEDSLMYIEDSDGSPKVANTMF